VRIRTYECLLDLYPFMSESYALSLLPTTPHGRLGNRRSGRLISPGIWSSLTHDEQDSLLRLLAKDKRSAVVEKAISVMMFSRPRSFSEPFVKEWLAHGAPEVRVAALELLESYKSRDVVPLITPLLKDRVVSVRATAVRVLGSLVAGEAVNEIAALLRDPSAEVRQEVKEALRAIETVDDWRKSEGDGTVPEAKKKK
jgi:hypothetical protein